jgi:hypothetical protein
MAQGFLIQITNNMSMGVTIGTGVGDTCFNVVPGLNAAPLAAGATSVNAPLYAEVSGSCNNAVLNVTIQAESPTGSEVGVQGNAVIAFDDKCSRFPNGSIYILSYNSQSTGKGTFFMPYILMKTVGSYTQATLYLVEATTQPTGSP